MCWLRGEVINLAEIHVIVDSSFVCAVSGGSAVVALVSYPDGRGWGRSGVCLWSEGLVLCICRRESGSAGFHLEALGAK